MAKLDEITELLTDELEGFRNAISELHTMSRELKSSEVVFDIHAIKGEMSELKDKQDVHFQRYSTNLREINSEIATAKLTPKWLLALFCITSAITVLTLCYFGYHFINLDEFKAEAFNNGKEQIILDLRGYFDGHPEAYDSFRTWSKVQDSLPNKK